MNKKNKYFREIPSIDEILNHSEVSSKLKSLNKNKKRKKNPEIENIDLINFKICNNGRLEDG